jgi:large subunit ribosomal protein L3
MLNSIVGKKIGMMQLFGKDGQVIPVTVIDASNWIVTQIKTKENDGYSALQLGLLRKKYRKKTFDNNWLKNKKNYFLHIKEVFSTDDISDKLKVGQEIKFENVSLQEENTVDVVGKSRGLGFQGVVRRWGFAGGGASHGSKFHRAPGAIGSMRTQGEVIKGKRLPGHQGNATVTIKGLKLVRIDKSNGCLFLKGAVPGKKDSLVIVSKQG